jgi:hypothetical protein
MTRTTVRGREIDLVPYYPCPWCGSGEGALFQLGWQPGDPVLPGLLMPEGPIVISVAEDQTFRVHGSLWMADAFPPGVGPFHTDSVWLTREVGRVPCPRQNRNHVYFDWRWRIDQPPTDG